MSTSFGQNGPKHTGTSLTQDEWDALSYEELRAEKVKLNHAYMVSLGLASGPPPSTGGGGGKTKGFIAKAKAKQPKLPRVRKSKPRGPARRSGRLEGATPTSGLSYAEEYQSFSDDEEHSLAVRLRKEEAARRRKEFHAGKRAQRQAEEALTPSQRKNLASSSWLVPFEEWLETNPAAASTGGCLSSDNVRQVMKAVNKLATGQGVHYGSPQYGWWVNHEVGKPVKGSVFMKGKVVNLQTDMIKLHLDSIEHIEEFGRDHGNGWLLNHPIRKLIMYQNWCIKHPEWETSLEDSESGEGSSAATTEADESDEEEEEAEVVVVEEVVVATTPRKRRAGAVTPAKAKTGRAASISPKGAAKKGAAKKGTAVAAVAVAVAPSPKRRRVAANSGEGSVLKVGDRVVAKWGDGKKYAGSIYEHVLGDKYDVLFDADGTLGAVMRAQITPA